MTDLGHGLTWRRLGVLIRNLPPSSRLARLQHGDSVRWGDSEHLLAGIYDLLAGANWQRGGGKGNRPTPVKRPGTGADQMGKAIPLNEVRAKLQAKYKRDRERAATRASA